MPMPMAIPKTSEGLYIDDAAFITDPGEVVRLKGEVEENYRPDAAIGLSRKEPSAAQANRLHRQPSLAGGQYGYLGAKRGHVRQL